MPLRDGQRLPRGADLLRWILRRPELALRALRSMRRDLRHGRNVPRIAVYLRFGASNGGGGLYLRLESGVLSRTSMPQPLILLSALREGLSVVRARTVEELSLLLP